MSVFSMNGCGACQRVAAMATEERTVFFTMLAVGLAFASLLTLLYRSRAPVYSFMPVHPNHTPWFGMLLQMNRRWSRLAEFRLQLVQDGIEAQRQAKLHQLLKEGQDGSKLDAIGSASFVQWGLPFQQSPFLEVLTPAGLKYLLSDGFSNFEKGTIVHDVFEELLGDGIFNAVSRDTHLT
jgi:hypothetical protein